MWIAFLMMLRLLHEWAHCLKTRLDRTESWNPVTKHCSAFAWSAVRSRANEYNEVVSSRKTPQKSLGIAYTFPMIAFIIPLPILDLYLYDEWEARKLTFSAAYL